MSTRRELELRIQELEKAEELYIQRILRLEAYVNLELLEELGGPTSNDLPRDQRGMRVSGGDGSNV